MSNYYDLNQPFASMMTMAPIWGLTIDQLFTTSFKNLIPGPEDVYKYWAQSANRHSSENLPSVISVNNAIRDLQKQFKGDWVDRTLKDLLIRQSSGDNTFGKILDKASTGVLKYSFALPFVPVRTDTGRTALKDFLDDFLASELKSWTVQEWFTKDTSTISDQLRSLMKKANQLGVMRCPSSPIVQTITPTQTAGTKIVTFDIGCSTVPGLDNGDLTVLFGDGNEYTGKSQGPIENSYQNPGEYEVLAMVSNGAPGEYWKSCQFTVNDPN